MAVMCLTVPHRRNAPPSTYRRNAPPSTHRRPSVYFTAAAEYAHWLAENFHLETGPKYLSSQFSVSAICSARGRKCCVG